MSCFWVNCWIFLSFFGVVEEENIRTFSKSVVNDFLLVQVLNPIQILNQDRGEVHVHSPEVFEQSKTDKIALLCENLVFELGSIQSVIEIGNLVEPVPSSHFIQLADDPPLGVLLSVLDKEFEEVVVFSQLLVPEGPDNFGDSQPSVLDLFFLSWNLLFEIFNKIGTFLNLGRWLSKRLIVLWIAHEAQREHKEYEKGDFPHTSQSDYNDWRVKIFETKNNRSQINLFFSSVP